MNTHALKYMISWQMGRLWCASCGISFGKDLKVYGLPLIKRHPRARISLGDRVVLTSDPHVNNAGILRRVHLVAPHPVSEIVIGDDSGLSGAVIYAAKSVRIGRHVNVGVNVLIYDNDLHPIDPLMRRAQDYSSVIPKPVVIEDDAWIGANAIILKGVRVGRGAVIGAGSVVARDVPAGEVWAGNPARFIKKIS